MKKLLALILVLILGIGCLASCDLSDFLGSGGQEEPAVTDADKVAADKAALVIENLAVTGGGTAALPAEIAGGQGSTITWALSITDVHKAAINGSTLTFASCSEDTTVKVIATIKNGTASSTKEFTFTVTANELSDAEKLASDKAALVIENLSVMGGSTATLPTTVAGGYGSAVTWSVAAADKAKASVNQENITFASCTADTTVNIIATIKYGKASDTKEFTFAVTANELTDEAKVAADKAALNIESLTAIGGSTATLPASITDGEGCTITWAVDTADAAKAIVNGTTLTFAPCSEDTTAKLIATIAKGSASDTKEFTFNITANLNSDAEKIAADKAALAIENLSVMGGSTAALPTAVANGAGCTIAWAVDTADTAKASVAEGVITFASCTDDTTVKVIATITSGEASDTKEFTFTVTANELKDEVKVATDKAALNIDSLAVKGGTATALPAAIADGAGSAITWAVDTADTAKASISDGTITFASCTEATTVKVIATITSGSVSDTKEFTFTVTANKIPTQTEITYRPGTETFDRFSQSDDPLNIPAGTTMGYTAKPGYTPTFVIDDDTHKTVLRLPGIGAPEAEFYVNKTLLNTAVSAAEAKGFEISFDIKLNSEGIASTEGIWIMWRCSDDSTWSDGFYMYSRVEGSTNKLLIKDDDKDHSFTVEGIDTTNWFNVRIVKFPDDAMVYIYINGNLYELHSGSNTDIANIGRIEFRNGDEPDTQIRVDAYIDNLYYGYFGDSDTSGDGNEGGDDTNTPAPSYKEGTETFDSYAPGAEFGTGYATTGEGAFVTDDDGHKTTVKLDLVKGELFKVTTAPDATVSAANAKGFEVSFDMKVVIDPANGNDQCLRMRLRTASGGFLEGIKFFVRDTGRTDRPYIGGEDKGAGLYIDNPAVDTIKWLNYRMVKNAGDSKTYVYLNDVLIKAFSESELYDITTIALFEMYADCPITVYVDNLYFGYFGDPDNSGDDNEGDDDTNTPAPSYKEGTETFDSYAAGGSLPSYYDVTNVRNGAVFAEDDSTHKTVLKLNYQYQDYSIFNTTPTSVTGATGFEVSFDIKAETDGSGHQNIELTLLKADKATTSDAIKFYVLESGSSTRAEIYHGGKDYYVNNIITDEASKVDTTKWFNIRLVKYADNSNLYVYVNNVFIAALEAGSNSDITDIGAFKMLASKQMVVYIDNLYFGYITDAAPAN